MGCPEVTGNTLLWQVLSVLLPASNRHCQTMLSSIDKTFFNLIETLSWLDHELWATRAAIWHGEELQIMRCQSELTGHTNNRASHCLFLFVLPSWSNDLINDQH